MALRAYMHWLALDGCAEPPEDWLRAIARAGYDGVQFVEPLDRARVAQAREHGLGVCGSGRVSVPADAEGLAREAAAAGLECLTLHVGWGLEDDDEALELIDAVLAASARHAVPMHIETHRATIFQDVWRTVGFIARRPALTVNADLSHWYTGLEFVYGGLERKLAFIAPVLDRAEFVHGRIGTPGCIQVDIGERADAERLEYVRHFQTMWRRVFESFIRRRGPDATLIFAPELLAPGIHYARRFGGREEGDRWRQAAVLTDIARTLYAEVSAGLSGSLPSRR